MKRMVYTSVASLMIMFVALTMSACFGGTSEDNNNTSDGPLSCSEAVDIEGELFLKLDVSCTQDSDCTVTQRGSCGCDLAVNKSADIAGYTAARQDLKSACGDSISKCEQLPCDQEVTEATVICNAQKRCDQPPSSTK